MQPRHVRVIFGLFAILFAVGAHADGKLEDGSSQGRFSAEIPVSARTRKGGEWKKEWSVGLDWSSFRCAEHRFSFERFRIRGRKSELVSRDLSEGSRFDWVAPVAWDWRIPSSFIPWRWSRDERNVLLGVEADAEGQPSTLLLCGTPDGTASDCAERLHGQGSLSRTGESLLRVWGGFVGLPIEGASLQKKTRWVGAFAIAPNSEVVARFSPASVELGGLPTVELRGRTQGWSSFQVRGRLPLLDARGNVRWKDVELFGPLAPMEDSGGRVSFGTVTEATPSGLGGRSLGFYDVNRCE